MIESQPWKNLQTNKWVCLKCKRYITIQGCNETQILFSILCIDEIFSFSVIFALSNTEQKVLRRNWTSRIIYLLKLNIFLLWGNQN